MKNSIDLLKRFSAMPFFGGRGSSISRRKSLMSLPYPKEIGCSQNHVLLDWSGGSIVK